MLVGVVFGGCCWVFGWRLSASLSPRPLAPSFLAPRPASASPRLFGATDPTPQATLPQKTQHPPHPTQQHPPPAPHLQVVLQRRAREQHAVAHAQLRELLEEHRLLVLEPVALVDDERGPLLSLGCDGVLCFGFCFVRGLLEVGGGRRGKGGTGRRGTRGREGAARPGAAAIQLLLSARPAPPPERPRKQTCSRYSRDPAPHRRKRPPAPLPSPPPAL